MAHFVADRIRETTTTTGTGTYTLAGAVTGFRSMQSVLTTNGDTAFFVVTDGTNWEVLLGTRASATTLTRTTIYASSNAGSAVNWGAGLKDVFGGVPARFLETVNTREATIASAATTDIGAHGGLMVEISGTVTITSLGTAANKLRVLRFTGSLTLTHNATTLILPGAANILTTAGDTALFASDASGNWRCYSYLRTNSFKLPTRQVFTSGSGTYTTPAGALWIEVELVGAGGGGGGSGTSGGTGGTGGTTTFGSSLLTGSGGVGGASITGGAGGAASGGDVNIAGGGGGGATSTLTNENGGLGGSSAISGGGNSSAATGNAGASGSGGGGGSVTSTPPGGGGGGAGGYVRKLIVSPAASYPYAVGTAGTAGTAGTSGFAGGAGGAGHIIVTEYYNT